MVVAGRATAQQADSRLERLDAAPRPTVAALVDSPHPPQLPPEPLPLRGAGGAGLGGLPPAGGGAAAAGRAPRPRPAARAAGRARVRARGAPPAAPRPPLPPFGQRRPRDMSGPRLSPRRHPYSAFAPPRPRPPRRSTSVSQPCATTAFLRPPRGPSPRPSPGSGPAPS